MALPNRRAHIVLYKYSMRKPNFQEEKKLWKKGYKYVVGLDEAGRGPLAGPVTAAAVLLNSKIKNQKSTLRLAQGCPEQGRGTKFKIQNLKEVNDSKKLTPKKREELYKILIKHPDIKWGIGIVSERIIDKINILEATKLAMEKAINNLKCKNQKSKCRPDFLILDGNFRINSSILQKSIIKGDERVFSIAAASILAKVTRDRIMKRYHLKYPCYGFDQHKGYPTKYHQKILKRYGPCKIHRKTFRPIKKCK